MTRTFTNLSLVLLLAASLSACRKSSDENEKEATPVPDVTVAKVQKGSLSELITVSGNLASLPNKDAKVAALVPGRVARVLVIEGDQVREGQPLATLDDTLLAEQERQAQAAVAQASANAENARIAADREQGLQAKGVSSAKEVEDARTQFRVNTALLKQAESALATAKAQVARAVIRAPFAGTVVKRFVGDGEQVDGTGAQPIVEVAQIDTLELMGNVPATRLDEIKSNESFSFQTTEPQGMEFKAKVASILPAVDPATNNGTVRIRIENPKRILKLGQFLSVNLPTKQGGVHLVVPRAAVYPDESGAPHIYKVSGDEAESVPVQLGVQTQDKAEIISGVSEGDTVVVNGAYGLPEKAKVHVKQ